MTNIVQYVARGAPPLFCTPVSGGFHRQSGFYFRAKASARVQLFVRRRISSRCEYCCTIKPGKGVTGERGGEGGGGEAYWSFYAVSETA